MDRLKEDICILVDIDHTYIQVVEPWETFLDPLSYELSHDIVIDYIDLLLNSNKDKEKHRFGTFDEITQHVNQETLEKASHKKVESIMKKALSKAGMTESEFEVVRETMQQVVLNIQPLSVSITETTSGQSIPYAIVSDVHPSE